MRLLFPDRNKPSAFRNTPPQTGLHDRRLLLVLAEDDVATLAATQDEARARAEQALRESGGDVREARRVLAVQADLALSGIIDHREEKVKAALVAELAFRLVRLQAAKQDRRAKT